MGGADMNLLSRRRVVSNNKLPYDAEIEYLESSGTQYIETGIQCDSLCEISGTFQGNGQRLPQNAYIFLGQGQNYLSSNIELYTAWPNANNITCCFNGYKDIDLDYTHIFNVTISNKVFTFTDIAGNVIGTCDFSDRSDFTALYTMSVFATRRSNYVITTNPVRCYSFKIIKNTCLIDLIPVRVGQVGYMYDKVSGQLFGNAGTGAFILGPDKTGGGKLLKLFKLIKSFFVTERRAA